MTVVVDEFGTTAGIVTIEDIVEEIIGEVLAERESPPIRWLDDGSVLVRGELNVHAANEALGTNFPEAAEFESIAGLLIHHAGRLVGEGESVTRDGVRFVAETVENNRILEVRIELPGEEGSDGSPGDGSVAGSEDDERSDGGSPGAESTEGR